MGMHNEQARNALFTLNYLPKSVPLGSVPLVGAAVAANPALMMSNGVDWLKIIANQVSF